MNLGILLSLVFSSISMAAIMGDDDRIDTKFASAELQELAKSTPALIPTSKIKTLTGEKFELTGTPITKVGICAGEAFSEESSIANCTASFIGKNRILTAAHCFNEQMFTCESYSVVFDYARSEIPMRGSHILDKSQIYQCKKVLFYQFDTNFRGIDLAVIELDRNVTDREAIKLNLKPKLKVGDKLTMVGYPLGISQKVVEVGKVLSVNKNNASFTHDLDTFSVNSGGPIFSQEGIQVGVLVRGTGGNVKSYPDKNCMGWGIGLEGRDYSEGNDLSKLKEFMSENR